MRRTLLTAAVSLVLASGALVPPTVAKLEGTPTQVTGSLQTPWDIVFTGGGRILYTELGRGITQLSGETKTLLVTKSASERKYLGLTLDPNYASNKHVYVYVSYTTGGGCTTNPTTTPCRSRVVRYTDSGSALGSPATIFDQIPSDGSHDGGRIRFGPDNKLYITTGDIHNPALPQDLNSLNGKILRINPDGSVPSDNPFVGQSGARGEIWSYGHRHPQGLAWNSSGVLYSSEHGPSGESYANGECCRDEINRIQKGGNFGWPTSRGNVVESGTIAPVIHSNTSTWAPSGAAFGADGRFYVPTLSTSAAGHRIRDFTLSGDTVVSQREHFVGTYGRLRTTVVDGGYLYFMTSNGGSSEQILRVPINADNQPDYAAQYVGQSDPISVASGDRSSTALTVDFRNNGTQTWNSAGPNPVRLAPSNPRDRRSSLYDATWISQNRVGSFVGRVDGGTVTPTTTIAPGETARFQINVTGPPVASARSFNEYFALVTEGITWFGEEIGQYHSVVVTPETYAYSFQGQTVPPRVMAPGQRATVSFSLRNEGTATWRKDVPSTFRIGTARPQGRGSGFANETWLAANRVANFGGSATVDTNQTATFTFDFTAPNSPGTHREYFQPVVEGFRWLNDIGMFFEVTVPSRPYDYAYIGQSAYPSMSPGGQSTVRLQVRNTGSQTWQSSGSTPVRLGTIRPADRGSGFAASGGGLGSGWLSNNRIKLTRNLTDAGKNVGGETSVAPGETAEFEFTVTGNPPRGTYPEYFAPVAEGITRMSDIGIFWNVTVN